MDTGPLSNVTQQTIYSVNDDFPATYPKICHTQGTGISLTGWFPLEQTYVKKDIAVLTQPELLTDDFTRAIRCIFYFLGAVYAYFGLLLALEVVVRAVGNLTSRRRHVYLTGHKNVDDPMEEDMSFKAHEPHRFHAVADRASKGQDTWDVWTSETGEYNPPLSVFRVSVNDWSSHASHLSVINLVTALPAVIICTADFFSMSWESRGYYLAEIGPATVIGTSAAHLFLVMGICCICLPYFKTS